MDNFWLFFIQFWAPRMKNLLNFDSFFKIISRTQPKNPSQIFCEFVPELFLKSINVVVNRLTLILLMANVTDTKL